MLSDRFADALALAAELHQRQVRKGTDIPYISHLLAVASLALEHGADEDTAIAALLHDAIEDCGVEVGPRIALRFGSRVLHLVRACSDVELPRGQAKPEWRARKQAYIAKISHVPDEARLIIACDKLHNLRSLLRDLYRDGEETLDRFCAPADLPWYYAAVAGELERCGGPGPTEELAAVSAEFGLALGRSAL
jgi:(p)ppGpp synthase/HD superfamily hydrolase